jgi:hypothetical protein
MRTKALQVVLIASALSGCASYTLGSVRPTYAGDAKLEISCAAFPNDKAEINSRLAQLYEEGWRIAASGVKGGLGSEPFICFERPAGMEPVKPVKAKPAPKPAPVVEEEAAPEEEAPKAPPPSKKGKKPAPPPDEATSDDASAGDQAAAPAPKPAKKRKPVLDE